MTVVCRSVVSSNVIPEIYTVREYLQAYGNSTFCQKCQNVLPAAVKLFHTAGKTHLTKVFLPKMLVTPNGCLFLCKNQVLQYCFTASGKTYPHREICLQPLCKIVSSKGITHRNISLPSQENTSQVHKGLCGAAVQLWPANTYCTQHRLQNM